MEIPEGFQKVYVHFTGHGTQQFFTAPSKEAASEFISAQTDELTEWSSAWTTQLFCRATDYCGFFQGGQIPIHCVDYTRVPIKGHVRKDEIESL